MIRHFSPIDHRPFQPKAKLEKQEALVARYGAIAIPELAAAIQTRKDEPLAIQTVIAEAA